MIIRKGDYSTLLRGGSYNVISTRIKSQIGIDVKDMIATASYRYIMIIE